MNAAISHGKYSIVRYRNTSAHTGFRYRIVGDISAIHSKAPILPHTHATAVESAITPGDCALIGNGVCAAVAEGQITAHFENHTILYCRSKPTVNILAVQVEDGGLARYKVQCCVNIHVRQELNIRRATA